MTQEEKYINFILNYNKKLKECDTDWIGPDDFGEVLVNTAEQNSPGCINEILRDIQKVGEKAKKI